MKDCAWSVTSNGIEYPEDHLKCNAEEADTRLWIHANKSTGKTLIFSPDTDVYHIGLTCADLSQSYVLVQINPIGQQLKLVDLNGLVCSLQSDGDIQNIPT